MNVSEYRDTRLDELRTERMELESNICKGTNLMLALGGLHSPHVSIAEEFIKEQQAKQTAVIREIVMLSEAV